MGRNICKSSKLALRKYLQFLNAISTNNKIYTEDIWIQTCVLALIIANAFKITKFTKLKELQ